MRRKSGRRGSAGIAHHPLLPVLLLLRMEEYELQNGPLPGDEKVGGWLRDVQAAYESNGPSC